MGYAYMAKAAASSELEIPVDWPTYWSYPDINGFSYPTTEYQASFATSTYPGLPWPPAWPIATPANWTLSVDAAATTQPGSGTTLSARLLYLGGDDNALRYHLLEVKARIGSTVVQLKKNSGDSFSNVIVYKARNYTGSRWGFDTTIYLDLDSGDRGSTVTITVTLTTLATSFSGSDTTAVPATADMGFLFGGSNGGSTEYQDVDAYEPVANSWTAKTNFSFSARYNWKGSVVSAKGYVFGGTPDGSTLLDETKEYAPLTDAFAAKTAMAAATQHHASSPIGSACYAYCGDNPSKSRTCAEYTPGSDAWAAKTDAPAPVRHRSAATTVSSAGYVFGGVQVGSTGLPDCDEFTAASNTWASKADMPTNHSAGRTSSVAGAIGSAAYVAGGNSASSFTTPACDEFTPASNTWANKTDVPSPGRARNGGFVISGILYVCAASDANDCDSFNPSTNTWTAVSDYPSPRREAPAHLTLTA